MKNQTKLLAYLKYILIAAGLFFIVSGLLFVVSSKKLEVILFGLLLVSLAFSKEIKGMLSGFSLQSIPKQMLALNELKEQGLITEDEFSTKINKLKNKL